jgi:hypothetical protein
MKYTQILIKKNSASQNKGTSESSQILHGSTPQRLASPMKSSKKMDTLKLSENQKPRQPIEGSKVPPTWFGAILRNYMENIKDMKESMESMKGIHGRFRERFGKGGN